MAGMSLTTPAYKVMTKFHYLSRLNWTNARAVCLGLEGDLVSIDNEKEMDFVTKYLQCKFSCPAGWVLHGLSCYKASKDEVKSWIDAKQDCHASGGYLTKIDNASEQRFIELFLYITGLLHHAYVWIGLSDIEHEGTFVWEVDNSTVKFSKWEPGQPNNYNDVQHCVGIGAKGYFEISCYQCSSNISFADCAKNQTRVSCTLPMTDCIKGMFATKDGGQMVTYKKGCAATNECRKVMAENPVDMECCSGDICNKGNDINHTKTVQIGEESMQAEHGPA
ncbi:chromatin-modulating protein mrc1 [Desmophyllum pertusum]|uniref:Chromatin-modulating protein mrc1 n=1 Tax=Desmophyllum pertusum TaxID=174260 RepID=A0A9X0CY61_9CNID|nr:chromatin-modulating protein mrc1 [Desmophyllum pertusum]